LPKPEPSFFFIKTETRIEKVNASEILYVEGMGDYWRIVTTRKNIMTLMNAKGLEEILREPKFCRVHKSWFVALDKIEFIERRSIKIADVRIHVSDSYQKHFFDLIERNKQG
jgi:two-component system, LytTR family, response regulator